MEDVERTKERIRKLLALSKSQNENEAAVAVKKANELMARYIIGKEDLVQYTAQKVQYTKRYCTWRSILANAVELLYATYHIRDPHEGTLTFFGDEMDVFMSSEVYKYLVAAVDRLTKTNIRKNAGYRYRQSYRFGCASRIFDRMKEQGEKCRWHNPETLKEMKKAISTYVQKKIDISVRKGTALRINMTAFCKGQNAGDSVNLNRQVRGHKQNILPSRI